MFKSRDLSFDDASHDAGIDPHQLFHIDADEYGYLVRRSFVLNIYGAALGVIAVTLFAAYWVGGHGVTTDKASITGLAGWAQIAFFGLAAWGITRRKSWGRGMGMLIALACLGQVAWYASFTSHWEASYTSLTYMMRFALGYLGCVGCFGTQRLFGSGGISHGLIRWAYLREKQERFELAEIHSMDRTASPFERAA